MLNPKQRAEADALYVLRWLLQVHETTNPIYVLPDNIVHLSRRSLDVLSSSASSEHNASCYATALKADEAHA